MPLEHPLKIRCVFLVNLAKLPGQLPFDDMKEKMLAALSSDAWASDAHDIERAVVETAEHAAGHLRRLLGESGDCVRTQVGVNQKGGEHMIHFIWEGAEPVHGRGFVVPLFIFTPRVPGAKG